MRCWPQQKLLINPDGFFRDKFRTGDAPLTGSVFYMVEIADAMWMVEHVANSMWALTIEDNWEKSGAVDVFDAVEAGGNVVRSFVSMVGAIFPVAWGEIPDNFLICDGGLYDREDYPALYAILDSAFIVDADSFLVPDLSGRVAVGESADFPIGDTGGEAEHTLDVSEMPSHAHTDIGHTHVDGNAIASIAQLPVAPVPSAIPGLGVTGSGSANLTNTGGDGAHNNLQPYLSIRYVIAAR